MSNLKSGFGSLAGMVKEMSKQVTAQVKERVSSHGLPDHLNTEETDILYSNYIHLGQIMQHLNTQIRESIAVTQKLSNANKDVSSFIHEQVSPVGKVDIRDTTEKLVVVQTAISSSLVTDLMNSIEVQLLRPFLREQQMDQETKRVIQEAVTPQQVVEHLVLRNQKRELVITQAVLGYMQAQQVFFQEVSGLYGDLATVIGPTMEKVKKGQEKAPTKSSTKTSQPPSPSVPVRNNSPVATKQVQTAPVKAASPQVARQPQTPPLVPKQNNSTLLFSDSTNDLLGDFGAPSKPAPVATAPSNGAPLFNFDDPSPSNGTYQGNMTQTSSVDFFSSPTPSNKQNNDFFGGSTAPKNSPSLFDLDSLSPVGSPQVPLQASTANSDPFAMFGVSPMPSSPAPVQEQANPTVVNGGVHPSFYNDHEEDKAKEKPVDRRPKQANDPQSVQQRVEDKINDLRARENQKEWESEARRELDHKLTTKIENWAGSGRKGNLRSLISTLHLALWEDSGWKEMPMATLIDANKLKLGYRKALLIVHPDKQTDKPLEQRFIAERVFELLTEAYKNEESIH